MRASPLKVLRPIPPPAIPKALLQLSASRGKLALELAEPMAIGPLQISRLVSVLEGLSFPVDLSGGVSRFRHRRGTLDLLMLDAQLAQLASYLTPKARAALDAPSLNLSLTPTNTGLLVGVHDDHRTLAFSAFFAPQRHVPRIVVADARGVGFGCPSQGVAIRLARAMCVGAKANGSFLTFERGITDLVREALIDAGARMPTSTGLHWSMADMPDGIRLHGSTLTPEDPLPAEVVRAIELAQIAEVGDEALARNQIEEARAAFLSALESAPRHPDLTLRIAEIDLLAKHTPESALACVVETMPALEGGVVAAEVLAAVGERRAASVALQHAAAREGFAPLAARLLSMAASHVDETSEQLPLLDEALARSPGCVDIRWQRAQARLAAGHFTSAVADLGQIEAGARGSRQRFDVCLRAGHMLLRSRLALDARSFFEKALRYSPTSADASTGLAHAFFSLGDHARGVSLLSRAITLSAGNEPPKPSTQIELARALAEYAKDLPTAIHHVRSIPFGLRETIAARALEGRWRHELGDVEGASGAFSMAREAAAHLPLATVALEREWLLEASRFELEVRRDARTSKRHAELALQAYPSDHRVQQMFRRAARVEEQEARPPVRNEPVVCAAPLEETHGSEEQRIEALTDRVRANPEDRNAVEELCGLLLKENRLMDLLALVSARLEETQDPSYVEYLQSARKTALVGLVRECREQGRLAEAEMYEEVLRA